MAMARAMLTGLAFWSIALQPAAASARQTDLEYSVKASYLVRFAAFVEWPRQAFSGPRAPLAICVVGRDPFGARLDRAAAQQTAFGRPLAVRRPTTRDAVATCQIVYVGQSGAALMEGLEGQPNLLTVTDSAVSAQRGMVHFAIRNGRVKFHIDLGAASRSGLAISSRLLNLALSVEGG